MVVFPVCRGPSTTVMVNGGSRNRSRRVLTWDRLKVANNILTILDKSPYYRKNTGFARFPGQAPGWLEVRTKKLEGVLCQAAGDAQFTTGLAGRCVADSVPCPT